MTNKIHWQRLTHAVLAAIAFLTTFMPWISYSSSGLYNSYGASSIIVFRAGGWVTLVCAAAVIVLVFIEDRTRELSKRTNYEVCFLGGMIAVTGLMVIYNYRDALTSSYGYTISFGLVLNILLGLGIVGVTLYALFYKPKQNAPYFAGNQPLFQQQVPQTQQGQQPQQYGQPMQANQYNQQPQANPYDQQQYQNQYQNQYQQQYQPVEPVDYVQQYAQQQTLDPQSAQQSVQSVQSGSQSTVSSDTSASAAQENQETQETHE